jgi:hypothetical protein
MTVILRSHKGIQVVGLSATEGAIMKDSIREAEKAELFQAVSALYIPLSLFLACVIMAAGTFLIYSEYPVGWALVAVSATIMISAFVILMRFQNDLRVAGIMPSKEDEQVDPQELAEAINKDLGLRFMPTVPLIPSREKAEKSKDESDTKTEVEVEKISV